MSLWFCMQRRSATRARASRWELFQEVKSLQAAIDVCQRRTREKGKRTACVPMSADAVGSPREMWGVGPQVSPSGVADQVMGEAHPAWQAALAVAQKRRAEKERQARAEACRKAVCAGGFKNDRRPLRGVP